MTIEAKFHIERGDFNLEIDLQIPDKGITALFGPSGCGKTTILRAIAGLEYHQGGFLKIGDVLWQSTGYFIPPYRRSVGYVFQEASLFPHLNVEGNLNYGARRIPVLERRVSMERAVELLGIGGLLKRRPYQLSGGECQRVAIARALAVSPGILLLDEPMAAIDNTRKEEILPYFESLHEELDIPIIYVSHSTAEVARLADFLVYLDSGKIRASGTIADMLTRLDLPLSHGENAESIIEATVSSHDPVYDLTLLDTSAGTFTVTYRNLPVGHSVRLRIKARDVSITLTRQTGTSILNIFEAVVEEIFPENSSQQTIRVTAGNTKILSRITRKSASLLGLKCGTPVYIQIKSVALMS